MSDAFLPQQAIEENDKIDYNVVINRFRAEQDFKSFEDYLTKHSEKIVGIIQDPQLEKDDGNNAKFHAPS